MYSIMRPWVPKTKPNVAIVGEAAGAQEQIAGFPFVGSSGQELMEMLKLAGHNPKHCYFTNVFMDNRPPNNNIETFFCKKLQAQQALGSTYPYGPYKIGKYLHPDYFYELDRLYEELKQLDCNLIVTVGATSTWAITGTSKISQVRGSITYNNQINKKILPTYHPAAVMRQWKLRYITISDFIKARREMQSPELFLPERQVWINPTISDLKDFYQQHIAGSKLLAVDVENTQQFITHISFAPDPYNVLVIPFYDRTQEDGLYWQSHAEHKHAWAFVKSIMEDKNLPKCGQNFMHDMQLLWFRHGIRTYNLEHDTMLQAHAIAPEMPKNLGFLGSIYTNEQSWKQLSKVETGKRED